MRSRGVDEMRAYWDERARENAAWFVDTSLAYDEPDMEQFWRQGERIVAIGLDEPPAVAPATMETAIEIGCGLGRICRALATRFDRVIGVDISETMIQQASKLVPNAEFELVDGASLSPVDDATVDLVFTFTVFQHIPDVDVIEQYIAEAGRVLRSGGVFAFQWNNEPGHRFWVLKRWLLATLQRTGLRREVHGRHAPAFLGSKVPLDRVRRALATAQLDLVATSSLGTLYACGWAKRR